MGNGWQRRFSSVVGLVVCGAMGALGATSACSQGRGGLGDLGGQPSAEGGGFGAPTGGGGNDTSAGPRRESRGGAAPGSGGSGNVGSGTGGGAASADGGIAPPALCPDVEQTEPSLSAVVVGTNLSGSASAAREAIGRNQSPLPSDIDPQDFINYYAPAFAASSDTEPTLNLWLAESELPSYYELLVAVAAPMPATRPSASLAIVVDNTQSIGESGLARAQAALLAIAQDLTAGDKVTLLSAAQAPQGFDITAANDPAFVEAVNTLALAPETDVQALILEGYTQAQMASVTAGWNRVVLLSDGEGDPEQLPATPPASDIRLVAIGVAPSFGHELLRTAALRGEGPYLYLDSLEEAQRLAGRFATLFGVAFDNVGLELTVPWYFEVERPFKGSVATAPSASGPEYVAPGGAMVFAFRLKSCHPDIATQLPNAQLTASATFGEGLTTTARSATVGTLLAEATPELDTVFAVITYAEALQSLDPKRLQNAYDVANTLGLSEIRDLLSSHPAFPTL